MSDLVPSPLADLAAQINEQHNAATAAATAALQHARNAGELLWQAKEHLGHGQWLPWLKENFSFTPRTAQNYMKLAKDWPRLQANAKCISHLGVRDALDLLADPKEDAVREPEIAEEPTDPQRPRVAKQVSTSSESVATLINKEQPDPGTAPDQQHERPDDEEGDDSLSILWRGDEGWYVMRDADGGLLLVLTPDAASAVAEVAVD